MRIKVHKSAKIDLLEGKLFYDDRQLGLGDYFESSLESDIESLKLWLLQVFSGNSDDRPFGRHTKARRLAESLTRLKRCAGVRG